MRLFVGYLISDETKKEIVKLQQEIKLYDIDCKLVEQENLHINLSFLGEISEEDANKVKNDLGEIAKRFCKIEVELKGIRAIPDKKFTRVIALEVSDPTGNLTKLMDEIIQKVGGDVKPPHITLCRIKSARNKQQIIMFVERYENSKLSNMKIESIQLIESKLGRNGPEYSVISENTLGD